MIYSVSGELMKTAGNYAVVNVHGLGLKIYSHRRLLAQMPPPGGTVLFYCHLHVKEDALDLFGLSSPEELQFFELLISISGVGPKSALAVLDVAEMKSLLAAIQEGRPDLLTQAAGIGRRTAERIILELRSKIPAIESQEAVAVMDADADLVEALANLGYRREQVKAALDQIPKDKTALEDRLKAALKVLGSRMK